MGLKKSPFLSFGAGVGVGVGGGVVVVGGGVGVVVGGVGVVVGGVGVVVVVVVGVVVVGGGGGGGGGVEQAGLRRRGRNARLALITDFLFPRRTVVPFRVKNSLCHVDSDPVIGTTKR